MQTQTHHTSPLSQLHSRAQATLMKAATSGLLDLDTLSRAAEISTCLALYLYVGAIWYRPATDPRALVQPDASSAEVMQLLHTLADSPDSSPSLFSEWFQLVPYIQTIPCSRQCDLARFISGLAPGSTSFDNSLEWITFRIYDIAHSLQSGTSLSGNVVVGIHDTFPLSNPPPENVCPPAVSPRKTRSGKAYPVTSPKAVNRIPKEAKRKRAIRTSSVRKARSISGPCNTSPVKSVKSGAPITWSAINPPVRHSITMTAPALANHSPISGRPYVWATTREELCQILPEFGQAQNDIVFGNTETPLLFVGGPAWEDDRWDGGRTIELSMVREFIRTLPGIVPVVSPSGDHIVRTSRTEAPPQPPAIIPSDNAEPQVVEVGDGTYIFAPKDFRQGDYAGCASAHDSAPDLPSVSVTSTVPGPYLITLAREPHPSVIENEDGTYTFVQEAALEEGLAGRPSVDDSMPQLPPFAPSVNPSPPSLELTALAPVENPPEIDALLLSRTACIPVSIVVCRNAALSPLTLPDGCGCAFLGFFHVVDVQPCAEVYSREVTSGEQPTTRVYGRKTWRFRFEWTPGGEDPDSMDTLHPTPWWQNTAADPERMNAGDDTVLQHPYTLLPLHFHAPPAQIVCTDADVKTGRGWHCTFCGRLNLQHNLCYQRCGTCSTSNGLAPISVEYVRQVRGTDPTAFPWDRYPESVRCISASADCPDGLRRFTYHLSNTATVHHMFTCNRLKAQAEPTRLFDELQAEVELVSEPSTKGRAGSPYYNCTFSSSAARSTTPDAFWSSSVPTSVSRARELMLRRAHASSYPLGININVLTISAWRTAGNKKGGVFAAQISPLVFLCLGADVEMSFWRGKDAAALVARSRQGNAVSAPTPTRLGSRSPDPAYDGPNLGDIDEPPYEPLFDKGDEYIDSAYFTPPVESSSAASGRANPKAKGKGRPGAKRDVEEALMVTLVHGDLLVVHGAVFEYSIKRMGMSIVLYGRE